MNGWYEKKWLNKVPREENRPCIFLDRDGVIIHDKHYLSSKNEVELHEGARALIAKAFTKDIMVVIVTNQSGIGRAKYTWTEYEEVTERMLELLGDEAPVTAIYANSYIEHKYPSDWRKPGIGMFLEADNDLNLDINRSILIGDRLTDIHAALNFGIGCTVHVSTGHGIFERNIVKGFENSIITFQKSISHNYSILYADSLIDTSVEYIWRYMDNDHRKLT